MELPETLTLPPKEPPQGEQPWTFLTNHAHVLLCLVRNPDERMRDVAVEVGITERAVQRIVHDLVDAGYLERDKDGRRNHYRFHLDRPLRHPVERAHTLEELVAVMREVDRRR